MKSSRILAAAALAASVALLASCAGKARINGTITDAPESEVIVSLLNVNTLETLDTVKTDAKGRYTVKVDVKKGCPEFVYVFRNGVRVAPVLLEAGAKVTVESDTLGNFKVDGSREAELYAEVEHDYAAFLANIDSLVLVEDVVGIRREYVRYYRGRLRFLAENSHSIATVPVLYQTVKGEIPVFAQDVDAIHFRNICDSLETVYPESRYVKALRKTADERGNILDINNRIRTAEQVNFPEIELPDLNANNVKLSEVEGKIVMLYFWVLTPEMKMFNVDQLLPLYKDFHAKGLEIYSVALEADKTAWATTVKGQKLPWINVCDIRQEASPVISLYNITSLPYAFFIKDGKMMDVAVGTADEIRKMLAKELK